MFLSPYEIGFAEIRGLAPPSKHGTVLLVAHGRINLVQNTTKRIVSSDKQLKKVSLSLA